VRPRKDASSDFFKREKQMSNLVQKFATAAMFAGLMITAAQAKSTKPFEGVVLVAAVALNDIQPQAPTHAAQPQFKRGEIVDYSTSMAAGSIVVKTKQNVLFFVLGNGKAVKYRVATAKKGFEWSGTHTVSSKTQWPDWRPPTQMRQRRPELPAYMAGGPKNPLGARAIYIGGTIYRIHGTNEPSSIGKAASSGCIRMLNEDVSELYKFVKHGATVTVL
jgi:lipoprotein-anchoring transpeptidase ErfK/SrfK